jgi:LacI family transcriptional regulator
MAANMKNVMIMVSRYDSFGNDLIQGVIEYSKFCGKWALTTELPPYLASYHDEGLNYSLEDSGFDGVIAYIPNRHEADKIHFGSLPAVIAHDTQESPNHEIPYITCDNMEIGELASSFFDERGYKNRGFFGFRNFEWSVQRQKGFTEANRREKIKTDSLLIESPEFKPDSELEKKVLPWLENLPKPACILCGNDDLGLYLIKTCKKHEIKVPDSIAILGVDNNEIDCNLTTPSLSSISYNSKRAGFQAAQTLDLLMEGKPAPNRKIVISPVKVVDRMSTNAYAVTDIDVIKALSFIKNNSMTPLQVTEVADAVNLSRRTLSRKFKQHIGRTIADEIKRAQTGAISQMLINSHMSVSEIAFRIGLNDSSHISRYFKMNTGLTPLEYRKKFSAKNIHLA